VRGVPRRPRRGRGKVKFLPGMPNTEIEAQYLLEALMLTAAALVESGFDPTSSAPVNPANIKAQDERPNQRPLRRACSTRRGCGRRHCMGRLRRNRPRQDSSAGGRRTVPERGCRT